MDAACRRAPFPGDPGEEHDDVDPNETPEDRVRIALQMSNLARDLARQLGAPWITDPPDDLEEKAYLWVRPMRLVARGRG